MAVLQACALIAVGSKRSVSVSRRWVILATICQRGFAALISNGVKFLAGLAIDTKPVLRHQEDARSNFF